ncbi:Rieske 2Fe-2S domain-containing protein [Ilumatobacter nonamiensis]|uniref:Rieske 2Fe-2S domain-containing protein n=1 Tax=Ilumatobacter nonamiensis TaxID=467093 RepID=UPI00058B4FAF|nr:Rieske 2Fe-2S domain-containing protein [Ilumatobacter nonamiensis]
MQVTSIGHAGMLIETSGGSILCDPWFEPAFFGAWFPFPRNDQLSDDLSERIENADFLYVSHLHGDHHDEAWLTTHLRRDIPILLPGYPTREQQRTLAALGFTEFIRTTDTEEQEIAPGLRVAIHIESSITDGPGGDSALVVIADDRIVVNQNDCRTTDLGQLRAHGPVDLHWLQFSGAIWYPMVYEMDPAAKKAACDAKVASQFARAMRYVEKIDAAAIVPSAGPPCFLDPDLFGLNMIDGTESSIFPDQTRFLEMLADAGRTGILNVPGTEIDLDRPTPDAPFGVRHPMAQGEVDAIFADKRAYLERYQADKIAWIDEMKANWNPPSTDLLQALKAWWEPLLDMAPTLRDQVGANVVLRAMPPADADTTVERLDVVIDFPSGEVRQHAGEPHSFRFDIDRRLVETVAAQRAVDWSNSLLLSCRFVAWRDGEFNEYVYNFFKSLSRERMRRAEAEAVRKVAPPDAEAMANEPDIRLGDYIVQRRCPHRDADLEAFGEIDGDEFVCTLHGWRFDLETGTCKTSAGHPLRIRRA